MNKILVLQGVPASGKSSWAKDFVKDKKDWVIVSRDEIREATGKYWVPEREHYISEVEEFQIKSAIKNNLNVIIDATNLNPNTIQKWTNLSQELSTELEFKKFEIDVETALLRDHDRSKPVGKKVLINFFQKYFPELLTDYYTDNRLTAEYDPSKPDCIICDLDGTLCLHQGRNPYDLTKVKEDKPNEPLLRLLMILNRIPYKVIFVSGREGTKQCGADTYDWLNKYYRNQGERAIYWDLLMRKPDDYRPDDVVKEELYHDFIEPFYNVIAVFDDRNKVVQMWRHKLGLLTLQVYEGDF